MTIYNEIKAERVRQDLKWGGEHWDDGKMVEDWVDDIIAYTTWAKQMWRARLSEKYRKRMMQVAALAVAACQSYDRQMEDS